MTHPQIAQDCAGAISASGGMNLPPGAQTPLESHPGEFQRGARAAIREYRAAWRRLMTNPPRLPDPPEDLEPAPKLYAPRLKTRGRKPTYRIAWRKGVKYTLPPYVVTRDDRFMGQFRHPVTDVIVYTARHDHPDDAARAVEAMRAQLEQAS